ncbi:PepSY domain-containing protein [Metabacillus sp. KIGAM252]|uniref:PepSY domain-containing protein n=1 Tax=Metabacillus flavus TaxID=2823519 RepID=A0ABS5LF41_9BACI|nr:PepSY domain-containing protein [Metabacillus flavus]MBS2969376.1 PepSY domain-containing protein [Metabacillus flavus]
MSKKWLILLITALAGIAAGWFVFSSIQAGVNALNKGHDTAKQAVLDQGSLTSVTKVTTFNGPNTSPDGKPVSFYAVHGKDPKGKDAIALIAANRLNEKPVMAILSEGISMKEAEEIANKEHSPKKMFRTKMGILQRDGKQIPVWEVKYIDSYDRYTYDYIDFKTGKMLHIAIK